MKKMIQLITIGATMAMFALPVATRTILSQPDTLVQDQCTQENKDAWYAAFRENFKTDQAKAYDSAKKYLTACSAEDTQITQYLKKWVGAYDKEIRKVRLPAMLYNEKKYPEAFALGKDILNDEPENLKVLFDLGYGGYLAAAAKTRSTMASSTPRISVVVPASGSPKPNEDWDGGATLGSLAPRGVGEGCSPPIGVIAPFPGSQLVSFRHCAWPWVPRWIGR